MKFITDYSMLNQKLVRNPFPLHRIENTIQKPECLQYVTALDINMGYYNIRTLPASKGMIIIVTEFDK